VKLNFALVLSNGMLITSLKFIGEL